LFSSCGFFKCAPELGEWRLLPFFSTATVLLQNLKPQIQYIQQNPLDSSLPAECNAPTFVYVEHCAEVLTLIEPKPSSMP
ncbi:hypothetical protein RA266_28650, partial [Pseudomonas syringae pv. tagetis]|uniref:hypothetical protein n=1 Tax=Pseudomonas syringae group genomosp. 7 TaxID=251699 RepID=UPI0037701B61